MYSISNETISIQVAGKGAELQSLYHKQNNIEYMWSGDPAYWGKKSPVLFPIVGELKNKSYTYKGQQYKLSRHGFARDMEFALTDQTEDSITFSIQSNEQTLAVYPFSFLFSIKYTLIENIVEVSYIVENTGTEIMYFSVGGHPAFKIPIAEGTTFEDYSIVFSESETAGRWPLSADGLIKTEPIPLLLNEIKLPLKKELFVDDAIVLIGLKSKTVSIESEKTDYRLKVGFEGFPYFGIWQSNGGDFVCLEPWCGIADNIDATGNLEEKEGIRSLEPQAMFMSSFTIQVF